MEQLQLFSPLTDPLACSHVGKSLDGRLVWCGRGEFWTRCQESVAGEPPRCAFDGCDNSPEAMERRKEWYVDNVVWRGSSLGGDE